MQDDSKLRWFSDALDRVRADIRQTQTEELPDISVIERGFDLQSIFTSRTPSMGDASAEDVEDLTSASVLGPPFGLALLKARLPRPRFITQFPTMPEMPSESLLEGNGTHLAAKYNTVARQLEIARIKQAPHFAAAEKCQQALEEEISKLAIQVREGTPAILEMFMIGVLRKNLLASYLMQKVEIFLDRSSRILLCTIQLPHPLTLQYSKRVDRKNLSESLLQSLSIYTAYLLAMSDPAELFDTVAVNVKMNWRDTATGTLREGIVASLQAMKSQLKELQPGYFEPKACFRHLAGIATPNIKDAGPIRPIFTLDANDNRIVQSRDVASFLDNEANLATMPWEDFEQLVRQLFEWEFAHHGIEVKATRASRDRGVDAIMYDPDPIRGGKFVLQAKRYARTVDVSAVRDLYGTVMNEGANRGILVTTATYGPDAYEFAKNKPISLIDGQNLILLLRKHARNYRINLEEAREDIATSNEPPPRI